MVINDRIAIESLLSPETDNIRRIAAFHRSMFEKRLQIGDWTPRTNPDGTTMTIDQAERLAASWPRDGVDHPVSLQTVDLIPIWKGNSRDGFYLEALRNKHDGSTFSRDDIPSLYGEVDPVGIVAERLNLVGAAAQSGKEVSMIDEIIGSPAVGEHRKADELKRKLNSVRATLMTA